MPDNLTTAITKYYDAVPYDSHPFPQSAAEHLEALAYLFGLEAAPPAGASVLELGCAAGGNLIPFAARRLDMIDARRAFDRPHDWIRQAVRTREVRELDDASRRIAARSDCARIGKENDRRFEAFGAMHGHHAHLITAVIHVAFHFRLAGAELGKELRQRRRRAVIEAQGQVKKFVDGIRRFRAETRQHLFAPAIAIEDA